MGKSVRFQQVNYFSSLHVITSTTPAKKSVWAQKRLFLTKPYLQWRGGWILGIL